MFAMEVGTLEKKMSAEVDRLSSLRDKILIHILSFLKAREVVQTSLISKRYQNLWASVPVLDLDFNDFLSDLEERDACEDRFVQFVSSILECRNPTDLEAFKLKWEYNCDPTPAEEWLEQVVEMNPKVIHFDVFTEDDSGLSLDIPHSVFVCDSLIDMVIHLQLITSIKLDFVNLPFLKRLTFGLVLLIDEMMTKLMAGCPNLEELVLCNCDLNISQIVSSSLKILVLDSCKQEYDYENPVIFISTPKLQYLEVTSFYMGQLKFDKMPSLDRAFVYFGAMHCYQSLLNYKPVFLTSLSNVTKLYLELSACDNDDDVKVMRCFFEKEIPKFPIFRNLKILKIGEWCMSRDFGLVSLFLHHSPNLEKLILLHSNSQKPQASSSNRGAILGWRDYLDSVEIRCQSNDKSVQELVRTLDEHVKTIHDINIITMML